MIPLSEPQNWKSVLTFRLDNQTSYKAFPLILILAGIMNFHVRAYEKPSEMKSNKSQLINGLSIHSWKNSQDKKPVYLKPNKKSKVSRLALNLEMETRLTVLANENKLIPIRNVENTDIGYIGLVLNSSNQGRNIFLKTLRKYAPVMDYTPGPNDNVDLTRLKNSLESLNTLIIGVGEDPGRAGKPNEITDRELKFFQSLHNPRIIWVLFSGSSALKPFERFENIILAYKDNEFSEKLSAETIFGAFSPKGILNETISSKFKKGDGDHFQTLDKIRYVLPENLGISPKILDRVDSIALNSIERKVFPGCVILAMKDGKIFYEKAFGTHTYKDKIPTQVDDVFDLASVTKISSTLLGVMKVYEQGLIHLDSPLAHYLPDTRATNKKDILLKDLLTHQAGLIPYIPFYVSAMKEKGLFEKDSSGIFTWRVADKMYERNNYFAETMWPKILESPLKNAGHFVYSDLSMYFMRAVLEKVSHEDLKTFVTNAFYKPLGLTTMGFNPRYHIPLNRIMPTEDDTLFRKQILIGDVHDPGAAMQNGVAGHAGLFSNASDLAVLGQMLLNQGQYGGRIYLKPETVKLFNTRPYPKTNRRALGFDKPDQDPLKYTSVPAMASYDTFGHTGFTGTCIWIDPRNKLIFVFLSNRVNPDAGNNKITELSIRPKIHTVFYEALSKAWE